MKAVPLFGTGVAGKSLVVTSQRRLNCYYEIREDSDKTKIAIFGTPGLTLFYDFGVSVIRGAVSVGNNAYIVVAGTLYSLTPLKVLTSLGTLSTVTGNVSMSFNGTQILIVDGQYGYTFTISGSVFAKITDVDFPNGAKTCTFQDGFFLVDNPAINGQFFKSALYDGTSWDALDYSTMVSTPNPTLAVDNNNGYVTVWSNDAIEFWQNTGSQGFPFTPLRSAAQRFGLAAVFSRADCNGNTFFLGKSREGQVIVMKLNISYGAQRVSNNDIDNIINSFSTVSDATAYSYMVDGHAFYEISFPTANRTFLYDDSTGFWSEVQTGTSLVGRHTTQFAFVWNGSTYLTDYASGALYTLDVNAYTDNGQTIKRLVQTRHQLHDMNDFSIDDLVLEMETGVGLQSGQGYDPQLVLQISKDKGRTFGVERPVSIGKVGQYQLIGAHWTRLGMSSDFVLRFYMTDPVKFVITAGYAYLTVGPQ